MFSMEAITAPRKYRGGASIPPGAMHAESGSTGTGAVMDTVGGSMLVAADTVFSKVTTDEYKPILIRYYPALAQHTYGFTIVSQFY